MTMRVYIAASSREVARVHRAQRAIERLGAELVHDWTTTLVANESVMHKRERGSIATGCIEGVRACELLWWLAPSEPTRGAWLELGVAIERVNRPIIIISGTEQQRLQSLFTHAPEVSHHATDAAAVALIAAACRMRTTRCA